VRIVAREQEQLELQRLAESVKPEFIIVHGRRRVGKTFLIRQFYHDNFCFVVTGKAKTDMSGQMELFRAAVREYSSKSYRTIKNWSDAFEVLRTIIEDSTIKGKKAVFLDEMPWLATNKSGFLNALEHFWNSWGSNQEQLLLIVCGSATSWMTDKILDDTGGLHNRITGSIHVKPFTLGECEQFYRESGVVLSRYQMVENYMIFGGIPYYLSLMRSNLDFTKNVDTLCFVEGAVLKNEFSNLYASLFKHSENHVAVVKALSSKASGLTRSEVIAVTGAANGGRLTKTLQDLLRSGFLRKYRAYGKVERDAVYQLVDPFTLFYLRFMEGAAYQDNSFWSNYASTPSHSAWTGYSFEMVALHHIDQIRGALGTKGVLTEFYTWRGEMEGDRAQVDLVMDRRDGIVDLCEMKYTVDDYTLDRATERNLARKCSIFSQATHTRKAVRLVLVTTYGLRRNEYSAVFSNVVNMDDLFG